MADIVKTVMTKIERFERLCQFYTLNAIQRRNKKMLSNTNETIITFDELLAANNKNKI